MKTSRSSARRGPYGASHSDHYERSTPYPRKTILERCAWFRNAMRSGERSARAQGHSDMYGACSLSR